VTKKIELSRSYLPIDPNTLPETMHDTGGEDRPEDRIPVIPFEGWNFMPTAYGWRSYFGINANLGIDALELPAHCRELFTFQKPDLTNFLVALCDTGIWTKAGESAGAWVHEITLVDPNDGTLLEWSYAILENALYVYRQGEANAYKCVSPGFAFSVHTPNTLNMAGQLGIFKAGGRLGFWDSADSVAYSSFTNFVDFVPSVSTLANITTIKEKIGKIINIVQHGDGFIVYATKSIIGVQKDLSNTFLWRAKSISNVAGIAYRRQVTISSPDTEHYAWTSIGLMRIRNFEAEIVVPELYDFLKETQDPIYLKILEGRYLAVQLANEKYVNGILSFYTETVAGETITLAEAYTIWGAIPDIELVTSLDDADARILYSAFNMQPAQMAVESESGGCGGIGLCVDTDYPVYQDKFISPVSPILQLLEILKAGTQATFDTAPFALNDRTRNLGSLAQPIGTLITKKATVIQVNKDYLGDLVITSDNEKNFYDKSTALWHKYNAHLLGYVAKLKNNLTELNPKLLTTGVDTQASIFLFSNETPVYPVGLGDFAGSIKGAVEIYPSVATPITLAAGSIDEYAGILPYAYELEYGKIGYTYYTIAKPSREMIYTGVLQRNTSKLKGLFQFNVVSRTGSGTNVPVGISHTSSDFGILISEFNDILTAAGLSFVSIATLTGAIEAYFIQNRAVAHQTGFAGLTAKNESGAAWAPATEGVVATYNVQLISNPFTVGTITFNVQASGLEAKDTMTTIFSDNVAVDTYCARVQHISYSHPTSFIRYNIVGEAIVSPNSPPAYSEAVVLADSLCGQGHESRPRPTLFNMAISSPASLIPRIDVIINELRFMIQQGQEVNFTFPGTSFLMQAGSPAPYEVLWKGAYVYDTQLKRWGKLKQDFYQLLDFSPLNSTALKTIPFTQFGLQAALLDVLGNVRLFDSKPIESYLKFGKYGNHRHGFTQLESIRADFRQPCSGRLEVEPSFDGRTIDSTNVRTYDYVDAVQIIQGHGLSARWHNIAFKGHFDLSFLALTSWSSSRR